jgi:hypothetical protein
MTVQTGNKDFLRERRPSETRFLRSRFVAAMMRTLAWRGRFLPSRFIFHVPEGVAGASGLEFQRHSHPNSPRNKRFRPSAALILAPVILE